MRNYLGTFTVGIVIGTLKNMLFNNLQANNW